MSTSDKIRPAVDVEAWDAVVVGAGPAGAVAALQLARRGLRVLIVEQSRWPRPKVCGGCLGGAALSILGNIGLQHLVQKGGAVQLRSMQLASNRSIAEVGLGRRMAISRERFDALLVQEAIAAGATFRDRTRAILMSPALSEYRTLILQMNAADTPRRIAAKVVLWATGLSGHAPEFETRIAPGAKIGLGAALVNDGTLAPGQLRMACGSLGYVGQAVVENGQVMIAAAVNPAALAGARSPGHLVSAILEHAGFAVPPNLQNAKWRGTPRLTQATSPLASHRCLVLGDAASYIEPFTGEGIGWAMHSALLACSLAMEGIEHWDEAMRGRWQSIYANYITSQQRCCRASRLTLGNDRLRQAIVWTLRAAPFLARPLVRQLDRAPRCYVPHPKLS